MDRCSILLFVKCSLFFSPFLWTLDGSFLVNLSMAGNALGTFSIYLPRAEFSSSSSSYILLHFLSCCCKESFCALLDITTQYDGCNVHSFIKYIHSLLDPTYFWTWSVFGVSLRSGHMVIPILYTLNRSHDKFYLCFCLMGEYIYVSFYMMHTRVRSFARTN